MRAAQVGEPLKTLDHIGVGGDEATGPIR